MLSYIADFVQRTGLVSTSSTSLPAPKLVAETPTEGEFDSLEVNGNSIFRGQLIASKFSLTSYNIDDLLPGIKFEGPEREDGISLLFADEKYVGSYSTHGLGAVSYIWRRENGQLVAKTSCNRYFAQKGDTLILNDSVKQGEVWHSLPVLWDLSKGRMVRFLESAKPTDTFPVIEGDLVFLQQPKGVVSCWDRYNGSFVKSFGKEREGAEIRSIFVDPQIIIAVENTAIEVSDRGSGELMQSIPISFPSDIHIETIEYKNDMLQINAYERMELWNIKKGERIYCLEGARCLFSDEECHYFANSASEIEVRGKFDGKLVLRLDGHATESVKIKCASTGGRIVSASRDGLKVWDKESGGLLAVLSDKPIDGLVVKQRAVIAQVGSFFQKWELPE